jgi:peptidoglycan L-alanyl-D-glutamate endopeptidase CwlK
MKKLLLLLFIFFSFQLYSESYSTFLRAYPDSISKIDNNTVYFKSGKMIQYDDFEKKEFTDRLTNSDVEDMISLEYPVEFITPQLNQDPGRFRSTLFFNTMYGSTPGEIESNLTTVIWMPGISNVRLRITKINGVDKQLLRVSEELSSLPKKFHKYVNAPAGTYVYRKIAGTNRLSAHSYGIAIDINIDHAHYWRWSNEEENKLKYKNKIPIEIVKIFEKHGFIWGGKWYHYDTMHFEYRPELIKNFTPDSNSQ